jgi:CRISPR-associated exonuclease Cas4
MQTVITVSSLPASALRQHQFCPRVPYFNENRGINPSDRPWQRQGVTFHKQQEMLNKRRNLSRFNLAEGSVEYQVHLVGKELPLHGVCDAVITANGHLYPLEFKLFGNKPNKGHKLQVAAYGMLLEQQFNQPVMTGFILIGTKGKTEIIDMAQWRNQVESAVIAIQANLISPLLPHSSASQAQCGQCEYLNYCADRF